MPGHLAQTRENSGSETGLEGVDGIPDCLIDAVSAGLAHCSAPKQLGYKSTVKSLAMTPESVDANRK